MKGATCLVSTSSLSFIVSIHAPVKGATPGTHASASKVSCFNPRTREGCDLITLTPAGIVMDVSIHAPVKGATFVAIVKALITENVSIHAPVKGATCSVCNQCDVFKCFNPRTREGCDNIAENYNIAVQSFNPRTREGCDWNVMKIPIRKLCFNPRTREGCDM